MTDRDRRKMKGNSPNPLGGTFGLVHGDQHRNHSNTPTGEDAAYDEKRESGSSGLHGDTGREDEDSEDDGPPSAEEICSGRGEESTEEGTSGQDGDDEGLLRRSDGTHPTGVGFTEHAQPVLHGLDTRDDTGIITKEDTTEGGEEGLRGWDSGKNTGETRGGRRGKAYRENTGPNIPWGVCTEAIACNYCTSWHD